MIGKYALLGLLAVPLFFSFPTAGFSAEKFPSKEIAIVVPYAAGGPVDLTTRIVADQLKKELGVPIVVENRPEANSIRGVVDVYKAKPDGYTLLANLVTRNIQQEIAYKPPYKTLEFTYLGAFQRGDMLVIVNKDSAYRNLQDLVQASKKKSLNAAVGGMGSIAHLGSMTLKKKVGVNLEVVPFKGGGLLAVTAVLGGNADLSCVDQLSVNQQREKLRPLAIFAEKRSPKFPDVPTFKELGYEAPFPDTSVGISAPPRLPDTLRTTLSEALAKAIKSPESMARIEKLGHSAIYLSGEQFHAAARASYKVVEEYKDIFAEQK